MDSKVKYAEFQSVNIVRLDVYIMGGFFLGLKAVDKAFGDIDRAVGQRLNELKAAGYAADAYGEAAVTATRNGLKFEARIEVKCKQEDFNTRKLPFKVRS